jgi:hypothetical protein
MPQTITTTTAPSTVVASWLSPPADSAQLQHQTTASATTTITTTTEATMESTVAVVVVTPTTCKISSPEQSLQGEYTSSLPSIVGKGGCEEDHYEDSRNKNGTKTLETPPSPSSNLVPAINETLSLSSSTTTSSSSSNTIICKRKRGALPLNRSRKECRRDYNSQQKSDEIPNVGNKGIKLSNERAKRTASNMAVQKVNDTCPPASALQSATEQSIFEQDAIDGLFMMTQSTPDTKTQSQMQTLIAPAASCDAAAGLLMMTKNCPNTVSYKLPANSSIESIVPNSKSNTTKILSEATGDPTPLYSPGKLLQIMPTFTQSTYTIDDVMTFRTMTSPLDEDEKERGCQDVHSCFVPPYVPMSLSNRSSTPPPTIKIVQHPPVEVVMDDGMTRKKGKFTSQEESAWARRFQQAIDFKRQHGHCRIPYQYPPNNDLVRSWDRFFSCHPP